MEGEEKWKKVSDGENGPLPPRNKFLVTALVTVYYRYDLLEGC